MTKYCEVCKQSYPETEAHCPHCAAAAQHHEEPGHEAPVVHDPDSAVDLGSNPDIQLPSSGAPVTPESNVAWAALAEDLTETPPPAPHSPPVSEVPAEEEPFLAAPDSSVNLSEEASNQAAESPSSGSDVLGHLFKGDAKEHASSEAEEEPFLAEPDSKLNLDAEAAAPADAAAASDEADEPFVAEADSGVNLVDEATGAHPSEEADLGSAEASDDDSAIDLAALVEGGERSSDRIGTEKVDSSGVNLSTMPAVSSESDSGPVDLAALSDENAEPLEEPEFPASPSAPEKKMTEEQRRALIASDVVDKDDASVLDDLAAVEAGGSSVNLGDAPVSGERPSSRDLIAEAVESGVDLTGRKTPPTEVSDEEPSDIGTVVGDSGVDLGVHDAPTDQPSFGPDSLKEGSTKRKGDEPVEVGSATEAESGEPLVDDSALDLSESYDLGQGPAAPPGSSEVDLGGATRKPGARPTLARSSSKLDLDEPAEAALDDEEPAAAALDEEEPVAAATDDEDDEKPAKPAKGKVTVPADEDEEAPKSKPVKPKYGRRWLAGGVVGALVGVLGVIGLGMAGINLPDELSELAGMKKAPPPQGGRPGPQPQPAGPSDAEVAAAHYRNGDFDKALPALEKLNTPTDEQLSQRGTARWYQYLKARAEKGEKLNKDDADVKKASEELKKAGEKSPEAVLTLGHLQEATETPAAAITTYEDGLKRFGDEPKWKRAFESAVHRVQTRVAAGPAGGGVGLLDPIHPDAAEALVALLIAFQGGDKPAPEADDEAGNEFWNAARLAREGKFKEARDALENARKLHDKMRFSRLRKAQNPLSDPTEEIFLRCCAEMEAYWRLREYLGGVNPALPGATPVEMVQNAVKQSRDLEAQNSALATKLGVQPQQLTAGVDQLLAAKKKADADLAVTKADLNAEKASHAATQNDLKKRDAELVKANDQIKTLDGTLKSVGQHLTTAGAKSPDPIKGIDELATDRDAARKALKGFETSLANAKYFVPGGDSAALLVALNTAIRVAQMKDPQGEIVKDEREIARLNTVLSERRTPAEMVDLWFPVVADRTQRDAAIKSVIDAERALKEPNASPALTAKATALLGLAQRNIGLFNESRSTLAAALKTDVGGDWQPVAAKSLKELTDPTEYYLPRARALYAAGQNAEALAALDDALQIFPKDNAPLLALRSLVRLDLARDQAKGKLTPDNVAPAKKDADAAVAAGLAEGHFALGRIAEELNDLPAARKSYAAAKDAHPGRDDEGNRYRVALARVLLKLGATGRADVDKPLGLKKPEPMSEQLASLILLLQLGAPPDVSKEAEEANKLADEILASPDTPNSFMLKAQAYAVKGRWNEALRTFALGLRPHIRRDYADVLIDLVNRHPMLRRPDKLDIPDPLRAEAFFTTGLRHFGAKNYLDAEKAFLSAVEADNQDARYFYYLGLTRMALCKRDDATADYQQGAVLEGQGKPGRAAVSESLEGIQGTPRQILNSFRP
jgi:tetratricopeptide (TPR) repeat protein